MQLKIEYINNQKLKTESIHHAKKKYNDETKVGTGP